MPEFCRASLLACLFMLIAACGSDVPEPGTAEPAQLHNSGPVPEKIHWFQGDINSALAEAAALDKPLFLYWGAEWCPPCHELKATVFQEPGFIAASRQFIAVYLDGDAPGAQQLAERFGVMGYPTLVVFSPAGEELARIPNGLDLAAYANILQFALADLQAVDSLVNQALQGAELNEQACQMLAQHSWQQHPSELDPGRLAQAFAQADQRCSKPSIRAQLFLLYLLNRQQADRPMSDEEQIHAVSRLGEILQDPQLVTRNLYLMLEVGPVAWELLDQQRPAVHELFTNVFAAISQNAEHSVFVRIQALRGMLAMLAKPKTSENARATVVDQIMALQTAALKKDRRSADFHATINAAGNMLREAGLLETARDLLSNEANQSRYAYYYMLELADVEKALGNTAAALGWLEQAYASARGPATRFQWGVNYLLGLLDMDPDNIQAIDAAFSAVVGELAGAKAFYQRSRVRLQRLDSAFQQWAVESQRQQALKRYRETMQPICKAIPQTDPAQRYCSEFLAQ